MCNPFTVLENRLEEIQETLKILMDQKGSSLTISMKKEKEPARRKEAAIYLGISVSTVINLEKAGHLKPSRIGKSVRHDWLDLENFRNQSK